MIATFMPARVESHGGHMRKVSEVNVFNGFRGFLVFAV